MESRPIFTEVDAVKRALLLGKETGCKLHFVHISSGEAVEEILKARKQGQEVTIESCPHYFMLDTETFEKIGPVAKCAPRFVLKQNKINYGKLLRRGKLIS